MSIQFRCSNPRRAQVLSTVAVAINGIDFLEVLDHDAPPGAPPQRTLLVHMIKDTPWGLGTANVRIEGGARVTQIKVEWAVRAADAAQSDVDAGRMTAAERAFYNGLGDANRVLVVRVDQDGDFSAYKLRLVRSTTDARPPVGFDAILSEVEFSFKVECPTEFDCAPDESCPPVETDEPVIDYLARDYSSLRRLLLDRLAVVMPDWQERNAADLGIALVELLAYTGDYLSYYQDAVATEAYLDTARRRVSLRRHARLLDYPMHDGCNARAWVQVQVDVVELTLPKGTPLLTRVSGLPPMVRPNSSQLTRARMARPVVFETMETVRLFQAHNELSFYTWGDERCCLPAGATRATLRGDYSATLAAGDVLVFVEKRSPRTGYRADADLERRHVVRLTRVTADSDPLGGQFEQPPTADPVAVTEIEWVAQDALPFILDLSEVQAPADDLEPGEPERQLASVALGNMVLADHGETLAPETLPAVVDPTRYRPALERGGITHTASADMTQPATQALRQFPQKALPAVTLLSTSGTWTPVRDLLNTDRFQTEFVAESDSDERVYLRFGDGRTGRLPLVNESFAAIYRIGGGEAGNVGAGALAHAVTTVDGITAISNPLPAAGGVTPESLEEVRQYAPQAFRTQERAVTEADYAEVAERHPEIQRAVATRRWTGSWYTMFLTVDRKGGLSVDAQFEAELRRYLERFRLSGQDLEIDGPRFVSLDIAFIVCVEPNYFASNVKAALMEVFSSGVLPDRTRGFFHPDNFTVGQPVYLSQVVATAMAVPGVRWIDTEAGKGKPTRFQRWGEPARDELAKGQIDIGRLEIARLDNDPSRPENGKLEFIMEGGL
ncbi:MAG: putative baseplate assembly protein [Caldilineaceae bacterium]|nr:putative baseplate assembly protein [Caldilineaceae bacterium]